MARTTSASTMAKRVLISALVGVLVGAFVVLPLITATTTPPGLDDRARTATGLLMSIGNQAIKGPGFAIVGLLVASPLIAIAVVAGVLFRSSVDRYPLVWSSIAPVLVWLFTCSVFALQDDSQPWMTQRGFFRRMLGLMQGVDNSLFFFAPAAAAMCFAVLMYLAARRT